MLQLIGIQDLRVLDEVVFRLVPGWLVHGVGDAAHRVPNQPHMFGADSAIGDRGRQGG